MDFSGQRSRVIENPTEALSVAVEEGLAWRVLSTFTFFENIYEFSLFFPNSWDLFFPSLLRKKDAYAWAFMVAPQPPHRALPQTWVCLLVAIAVELVGRYRHLSCSHQVHRVRGPCRGIVIVSNSPVTFFILFLQLSISHSHGFTTEFLEMRLRDWLCSKDPWMGEFDIFGFEWWWLQFLL